MFKINSVYNLQRCHFSKLNLLVYQNHHGVRIDKYLMVELQQNWNLVHRIIRNGEVIVNNKKIRDFQNILNEGDNITIWDGYKNTYETNKKYASNDSYEQFKKMIIFENDDVIIINKLTGYASQGGADLDKNIPNILNLYHKNYYIIHRLDQLASGLLIIAKNKDSAVSLSNIIQNKIDIKKEYITIVQGIPKQPQLLIETPLTFNMNKQKTIITQSSQQNGKQARTYYEIKKIINYFDEQYSLLNVQIYEGRKHQIRAHLSQVLGTPILFDQKYGFQFTPINRQLQKLLFGNEQGMMLHSQRLTILNNAYQIQECNNSEGFIQQEGNQTIIESTMPKQFQQILNMD